MQFKTAKPSRRMLLSLAVMATLAPAGMGLRQMLALEHRTAAGIADLGSGYEGGIWSNRNLDTQNTPATLVVTNRVRTRFTGTLNIGNDSIDISVSGGVNPAGRVVLNGSLNQAPYRLRLNITGQLSAGGNAIIGTYTATGRSESGPINDRGSVVLLSATRNDL